MQQLDPALALSQSQSRSSTFATETGDATPLQGRSTAQDACNRLQFVLRPSQLLPAIPVYARR